MIVFLDSSVLLRKLFREPAPLAAWRRIERAYASRLLPIEVGRVIDRCRLDGRIDDEQVEALQTETREVLRSVQIVAMSERTLRRATGAMPTVVGTLDGIHLATALELGPTIEGALVFATHDLQLARAARASGLDVVGVA